MNATDILKYGHITLQQAIEGFPETAWDRAGACGSWSVKDIVAHLASFEQVLVDVLHSLTGNSDTPALARFIALGSQFGDAEVDERKGHTAQDNIRELHTAHAQVMSLITSIPAETLRQLGTLPWYGVDYALDDLIVYMYYGHKREHSAQIAAFREHL
jgi:hypothetical protein